MPSSSSVLERLKSIPEYVGLFKSAFPADADPVSYDNVGKAIAAFERTLVTPSRFDRFLRGDAKALTAPEKRGLTTFIAVGCSNCHNGAAVGGQEFEKFGVHKPYWELTGSETQDPGKFSVTQKEADRYFFKVPSLRNTAMTYPYFHDGSVWDLQAAVHIMAKGQLNKELSSAETRDLVAFLNSLTGEIPKSALELPVLPPSRPDTPKPEFD